MWFSTRTPRVSRAHAYVRLATEEAIQDAKLVADRKLEKMFDDDIKVRSFFSEQ